MRFSLDRRRAAWRRYRGLRPVQLVSQHFALRRAAATVAASGLNPDLGCGLVNDQRNGANRDGLVRRLAARRIHLPGARKIAALRVRGKREDQQQSESSKHGWSHRSPVPDTVYQDPAYSIRL